MDISRGRLENVVDAVAEALGVDSGTIHEARFEAAVQAAQRALTPSAPGYLSCEKDGVKVHLMHVSDAEKAESQAVVTTMEGLVAWCKKYGVDNFMCSSSMDFPEEYTDDPQIVALCQHIRSDDE